MLWTFEVVQKRVVHLGASPDELNAIVLPVKILPDSEDRIWGPFSC
jgi:hypothetical protein